MVPVIVHMHVLHQSFIDRLGFSTSVHSHSQCFAGKLSPPKSHLTDTDPESYHLRGCLMWFFYSTATFVPTIDINLFGHSYTYYRSTYTNSMLFSVHACVDSCTVFFDIQCTINSISLLTQHSYMLLILSKTP